MTLYTETENGRILNIDLFHGTSSLFLDSIIEHGLGAVNPLEALDVYKFSKEVYDLSVQHLKDVINLERNLNRFKIMVSQDNPSYQHGSTYVTPFIKVACNYVIGNKYGSELLTNSIYFLEELIRRSFVSDEFKKTYKNIFDIIKVNPTPILIKFSNINVKNLVDEEGKDPVDTLIDLEHTFKIYKEDKDRLQNGEDQGNFRLTRSVTADKLKVYLINVRNAEVLNLDTTFYEIQTPHSAEYSL